MSIILHDEAYYASRIPRPDLGPIRNFMRFIWDNERKALLDRTAREWGQLGIFYLCFYTVLASIFAVQMKISVDYVSQLDKPFFDYTTTGSLVGQSISIFRSPWKFSSPGIAIKPRSVTATSPIILVNNSNVSARPKRYIRALTDFLQEYNKNKSNYDVNCGNGNFQSNHSEEKPCFFDIKNLGACSRPPYGYAAPLQPCVLIKFNKRFDWAPKYYNQSSTLPEDMPANLKKAVQQSKKFYIWLSCDGANNVDKEHIGEVEYIPSPGFPVEYFPFTGQPDYLSPIVALRFKNLTPDRLVTVECNLWAANIEQHSRYSLDFQIIIDS
ncbi:sodium/potassium-transporting ATPase subunit beta-1-like isoform X2 [Andrena cerasifolii]|uniref:sodium/potassium-transporting ATPase subunit beta-1-like isoform X2 n=1 Tax=Andrena cerasifolii TaxID=2819439 RepID=UPI004037FC25